MIELEVGVSVHKSIEQGIKDSRFFCLALSLAALQSYYVREIEFEQAFSQLVRQKREKYILPIIVQKLDAVIPERISHLYHLDFTKRNQYTKNVKQLVNSVRGINRDYTGSRWFKHLNISNLGQPVGVSPTSQKGTLGESYNIMWEHGIVSRVDVYHNGDLAHYKEFDYDKQGRVVANKMYSPDGHGGWSIVEDICVYKYDPKSDVRKTKTMRYLGEATARVVRYDGDGRAIREDIMTDDGKAADRDFPYAAKTFDYDADGNASTVHWFDASGAEIPAIEG